MCIRASCYRRIQASWYTSMCAYRTKL